ncbi:MAG: aminotransferase class I/II-fold pyridoxal phosphate-dependent enzyme [Gemmatimonadetes bacterium]|nr:aminotransferase class I/II-fold pyridoxal phosphate-dependent enzyme [Gemmatimonadota bacterium]
MPAPSRRHFLAALGGAAIAARPVFAAGRWPLDSAAPEGERGVGLPADAEQPAAAPVLLNYNESAWGPSPRALSAIRTAPPALATRYFAEDTYDSLRDALAAHHGVTRAHIRMGAGSTEILKACDDLFLRGGGSVVVAEPTFEAVLQYAANYSGSAVRVPLTGDHRHDLDAMATRVTADTGFVYICNPNNPTGTIVSGDAVRRFLDRIPARVPVVFDEAYAEFVADRTFESAVALIKESRNAGRDIVVAKTFSKIHGLAGMRVGYAIARPEVIARLVPLTVDYAVTGHAAGAAKASLADRAHLGVVGAQVAARRAECTAWLRERGFECTDSQANFVMINLRRPVAPVIDAFATRGVLVGRVFAAMPNFLRVTMGTAAEMRRFYAAAEFALRPT